VSRASGNVKRFSPSLVTVLRNGYPETSHRLHWGLWQTTPFKLLDSSAPEAGTFQTFARSCWKPLQGYTTWKALEFQPFASETLALWCSSHSGTPLHRRWLLRTAERSKVSLNNLGCPPATPLHAKSQQHWYALGRTPQAICHNCSGKHLGVLMACQHQGWPTDAYRDEDHSWHAQMRETAELFLKEVLPDWGLDDCGLSVPYLRLEQLAQLYTGLWQCLKGRSLFEAMSQNPYLVAGPERLDTHLMQKNPALVSKTGAAGLSVVLNRQSSQVLVLKVESGNLEVRDWAVTQLLQQWGWIEV
jgi:L-asparaginase II